MPGSFLWVLPIQEIFSLFQLFHLFCIKQKRQFKLKTCTGLAFQKNYMKKLIDYPVSSFSQLDVHIQRDFINAQYLRFTNCRDSKLSHRQNEIVLTNKKEVFCNTKEL